MLQIKSTPKTIQITDNNGNTMTVIKTDDGIQFHTKIEQMRIKNVILSIQTKLKNRLINFENKKLSFKDRLGKIQRELSEQGIVDFKGLYLHLSK